MQVRLGAFPKSWVVGAGCFVLLCSASVFAQPDGFRPSEWAQLMSMADLPDLEPDPANRYGDNRAAVRLGQMVFFDPRFSNALQVASDLGNRRSRQSRVYGLPRSGSGVRRHPVGAEPRICGREGSAA